MNTIEHMSKVWWICNTRWTKQDKPRGVCTARGLCGRGKTSCNAWSYKSLSHYESPSHDRYNRYPTINQLDDNLLMMRKNITNHSLFTLLSLLLLRWHLQLHPACGWPGVHAACVECLATKHSIWKNFSCTDIACSLQVEARKIPRVNSCQCVLSSLGGATMTLGGGGTSEKQSQQFRIAMMAVRVQVPASNIAFSYVSRRCFL